MMHDEKKIEGIMRTSYTKNYNAFKQYLARNTKTNDPGKLVSLFLRIFAQAHRPTQYQRISLADLQDDGIQIEKFTEWRWEMVRKGILICAADITQIKEKSANPNANLFKYGTSIKKYIEEEMKNNIFVKIDSKADLKEVEKLQKEIAELKNKVSHLNIKMDNSASIILKTLPPDTPERKQILEDNLHDVHRAIQLLNEESERNPVLRNSAIN
jgi:hypothetical protein